MTQLTTNGFGNGGDRAIFVLNPLNFNTSSSSSYWFHRLAVWLKRNFDFAYLPYLICTYPSVTTWQDKEPANFHYLLKFSPSQSNYFLPPLFSLPWNLSISVLFLFLQLFSLSFCWLSYILPNWTRPKLPINVLFLFHVFSRHTSSKSIFKIPPSRTVRSLLILYFLTQI